MASIIARPGKTGTAWRVQVRNTGIKSHSFTFDNEANARAWASAWERPEPMDLSRPETLTDRLLPEPTTTSALTGRAGVALVQFQLGRRGFEFVETPLNSDQGDLWANTRMGRLSLEVKTSSSGLKWIIRKRQTNSEIIVLVSLMDAQCYVLTRAEVAALAAKEMTTVYFTQLPGDALDGWGKIGGGPRSDAGLQVSG
jgi:hypothetical protein